MKNIVALFLLLSSLCVIAQDNTDNQFYVGVNSGMIYSRANLSSSLEAGLLLETEQEFISNIGGGIVFIYYSEPRFGIQLEANYSQRGWAETVDSENSYSRKLTYLEFPILSHFDIPLKAMNIALSLGPAFSYFLSSQEDTGELDESLFEAYYGTAIDNQLEAGLCLGLGFNKFFGKSIIQVEGRFNLGLSNLFSDEHNFDFTKSQNQLISIKASYLFGW